MAVADAPTGPSTRKDAQVLGRGKPWGKKDMKTDPYSVGGKTLDNPDGADLVAYANLGGLSAVVMEDGDLAVLDHGYEEMVERGSRGQSPDNRKTYVAYFGLEKSCEAFDVKMEYVVNGTGYEVDKL